MLFLGFAIAFAPASIATNLLEQNAGANAPLKLIQPAGTLWQGSGQLMNAGYPFGQLSWQAKPSALLSGKVGADVQLALADPTTAGGGGQLKGNITSSSSHTALDLSGTVAGSWVSQWLAEYEVNIGGELSTENLEATLDPNDYLRTLSATGDLTWSGGLVRYRIGNTLANQRLEPMRAVIQGDMGTNEGILAEVFGQESYPLLLLAVQPNGHVKVSITQRLTEIVGSPWPGSEPDHAFVLVVEQAVF